MVDWVPHTRIPWLSWIGGFFAGKCLFVSCSQSFVKGIWVHASQSYLPGLVCAAFYNTPLLESQIIHFINTAEGEDLWNKVVIRP